MENGRATVCSSPSNSRDFRDAPPPGTDAVDVRVLGELTLLVGGTAVALPRSRKTRALLAYLAVTGRAHRREPLSALLWDVADDRRAALRWSLSKLRATLGAAADRHFVATREHVELRLTDHELDLARLRKAVHACRSGDPADALAQLESLVTGWNGELLEGLLLPDFDTFEAWLEAERMEARALHLRARRCLVEQLHEHEPPRAFLHARAWHQAGGGDEAQTWLRRLEASLAHAPSHATTPSRPSPVRADPPITRNAPAPPEPLPSSPWPPLCGRIREMARLGRLVDATVAERRGHVALVLGDAGYGKTRLLEELRHRTRERAPPVLDVLFHEGEEGRPLGAFWDALPERHPLLTEDVDRDAWFETIADLVRRDADQHGLGLLVLDDAHLADASSCELLHFLVRTAARVPLLTVVAARTAEFLENAPLVRTIATLRRRHPVEELRLAPLDAASTRQLVAEVAPAEALDAVVQQSGGVPLIALALAHHPATDGSLPPTLADLVTARVAQLSAPARALVRWAAVLEQGALALLERLCAAECDDFVGACEMAARYELIRIETPEGGRPRFRMGHALVREAIDAAISEVRRAAMHRAIAEAMTQAQPSQAQATLIAHHAARAGDPSLAAAALVRGASRAAALGAPAEALALLDRAFTFIAELETTDALPLEIDALALQLQLRLPSDPAAVAAHLTRLGLAAVGLGATELASRAFHAAGRLRWDVGEGQGGCVSARQAWHAAAGGTAAQRVRGGSMLALCLVLLEKDLPEAHALVVEAEALATTERPAELVLARAQLHAHAGHIEEARQDLEDARTLARVEGQALREASALLLKVRLECLAGDRERMVAAALELRQLAQHLRAGSEAPFADAALALAEPELDLARPKLAEASERLHALDDKRLLAWVLDRWARRERTARRFDDAAALARRALHAARAVESRNEAALAACELMTCAQLREHDEDYAAGETVLAELEAQGSLSSEARAAIAALSNELESPHQPPEVTPWNSSSSNASIPAASSPPKWKPA